MGACYYVEYELYEKNKEKCKNALKKYLENAQVKCKGESLEELIQTVLFANKEHSDYVKHDENHYSSSFDASYMYEIVLNDAFVVMSPYLADGSKAYIEPDNDYYMLTMKNGQCINTKDAEVKKLCKKDIPRVQEMDEISGCNVLDYLVDFVDDGYDEADNCFGIFYEDELVGYCSLGYAAGSINVGAKGDDVLLSDVYIKKEWRHMRFGSKLIREVTDNLDDNCYLTLLYDDLEKFYSLFDFESVKSRDNIMIKYCV